MKSSIGHLQINVNATNLPFYKDLLSLMGWSVWYDSPAMLGMGSENGASLWFAAVTKETANDYDGIGMNHIGLAVESQSDVDLVVDQLMTLSIPALFNTPCHRPEFSSGPEDTYYQVMFESPDRVLFEVVYIGPKT